MPSQLRTHCRRGHNYEEVGYYTSDATYRKCKACIAIRRQERMSLRGPLPASRSKHAYNGTPTYDRPVPVDEVFALQDRIEREPRKWIKNELRAELAALLESTRDTQDQGSEA